MKSFGFSLSTQVQFGPGSIREIVGNLETFNTSKPLLVTDKGLVRAGVVQRVLDVLDEAGIVPVVFDAVEPNPTVSTVEHGERAMKENNCDAVIGLGGGSSLDTAKAVAVMGTNPGHIADYFRPGEVNVPPTPVIAVPTTAGTGSEVTPVAVITDVETKVKKVVGSPLTRPRVALLDPNLLTSLPSKVVAETGMDALTHAVESYVSLDASPVTDALAIGAIRIIGSSLREFASDPSDVEHASSMLVASNMAAMAFSHSKLGTVHALSHPVSCYFNLPHGLANAILLPYVVEYNLEACPQKFAAIAEALGKDVRNLPTDEAAALSVTAIMELLDDLGLPRTFEGLAVNEKPIPNMVKDALESVPVRFNPRRCEATDLERLYRRVI